MIYEVSEGKETFRVELKESGEGVYELTIDGRTVHVDAAKSGRTVYSIIEEGRQFEGMVEERSGDGFDVMVAGQLFRIGAIDERTRLLSASARASTSGPQTVIAEMPGKIVKVQITAGEPVTEGQGCVVIEAMKMENEITSPIDGVVSEVSVSEGDTVEGGASLFVVAPRDS